MPVLLTSCTSRTPAAPGARRTAALAETRLASDNGVIVYDWDRTHGTLLGTFVLAMYDGAVAKEKGHKVAGKPDLLDGTYAIETYTPEGDLFSEGRLVLTAVGRSGAYDAVFILHPTPANLAALGYAAGTALTFKAIGYKIPDRDQLAVSWDNDLYTRSWGASQQEWGYRQVTSG
jgi:hypothetical protein